MAQKNNSPSTPPRELAKQLLHALKSERVASVFLESYAKQFDRPEAIAHLERRRELEAMLDREMLLAMAAHVARVAESNARRSPRRATRTRNDDPAAFLRDLVTALAKESGWTAGDPLRPQWISAAIRNFPPPWPPPPRRPRRSPARVSPPPVHLWTVAPSF